MTATILWCPDSPVRDALQAALPGLVVIERDDDAYTPMEHAIQLTNEVSKVLLAGEPAPTVLIGAEAFGWACVGMLGQLRDWLVEKELAGSSVVVYSGPGQTQLGRIEEVGGLMTTPPTAVHGPSMMAPETTLRLRALGAVNLADPVGLEWLVGYTAGQAVAMPSRRTSDPDVVEPGPRPVPPPGLSSRDWAVWGTGSDLAEVEGTHEHGTEHGHQGGEA